jgi:small subunit ribosomal protein S8
MLKLFIDSLNRIRNGISAKLRFVDLKCNKSVVDMLRILKRTGFINTFITKEEKGQVHARVFLKYNNSSSMIRSLKSISTPGRECFVKQKDIKAVCSGQGLLLISTNKGIVTGWTAKKENVGGLLLAKIY